MNDKQKIFVMVAVGSIVIFPITVISNIAFSFESFSLMFGSWNSLNDTSATNWIGMIAVFNIVVSFTGFFLFADKK